MPPVGLKRSDSNHKLPAAVFRRTFQHHLSEALSVAGVYFEYLATSSLGIDEQIVKSATEGVSMDAGVRVIAGERTGYAYSDGLSPAKIRKAAHTAALIAKWV